MKTLFQVQDVNEENGQISFGNNFIRHYETLGEAQAEVSANSSLNLQIERQEFDSNDNMIDVEIM